MKAIGSNLIIQKIENNITKSKGGLLLNKNDRSDIRYIEATVISSGEDIKSLKKDDKIFADYQDYYLNEKWRAKITNEEIKFINSKLDQEVVNYFGYKLY